ncbi:hypothetical protein AB0333_16595 [Citricoccus sp. NPDC079358]|uniref:DUF2892 domain-containing protein n=2 Tax=Citricoccus TaxID=169133 RepID=A0ABV6F9N0_9MICC|nr:MULTISPECIES: hypothetical protein [Citricoccus]GGO49898.1 hypothetical protein GCM10010977_32850 [Citricoccus zhacaiensis]VXC19645.1 conserved hypothetical protein [Citricoccus sp. K5]
MADQHTPLEMSDPVRAVTPEGTQVGLDRKIKQRVESYAEASAGEISVRIDELEREWDIERVLELNASSLAFVGTVLGATVSRKWLLLPGVVLPFLFQHAIQGWCPPVFLFRRLRVRTRKEIELEKYALKALRGDFVASTKEVNPEDALRGATR